MTNEEVTEKFKDYLDCGIDIRDGWLPIINDLFTELVAGGFKFKTECIKEKFGGLRVYVGDVEDKQWDAIQKIISKYEDKAICVCEECGKPGLLRKAGWIKTLCNKHSGGTDPWPYRCDKNHICKVGWNICPDCKKTSCSTCSLACYQCDDAWRHKECALAHAKLTKHDGNVNDLVYLLSQTDTGIGVKDVHF